MGKYTQTSNSGEDEPISFSAGYGSKVSYGTHSPDGVRSGLEEGVQMCLLTTLATNTTTAGDKKKVCTRKIFVGNWLALHLLRRRHSTSNAPKAFWNVKQTLRGRLLLPIHRVHRSIIIHALSVLSVLPRFDAQKFRKEYFALGRDLRDHLIQSPHFIDKETLHLTYCQITFPFDNLTLVFISLSLTTQSNFYS